MTRLQAQNLIEDRLGQRTGLAARIVAELKQVQRQFERRPFLPWFLRTGATLNVYAGSEASNTPTNYLREIEDETFIYRMDAGKPVPLQKDSFPFLMANPDMTGTGIPKFYALSFIIPGTRDSIAWFPRPDADYSFTLYYYGADDLMDTDGTENRWLTFAPDLIVARAGLQLAKALRSPEAATLFMADLADAEKSLKDAHIARDMAARELVMGG